VTPTVHFNAIISRSLEPVLEARDSTSVPADKIGVPGSGFQGPKTTGQISKILKDLKDCDKQITPACLRVLYGVVGVPVAAAKNSYAIGT
jgi:tripeptidyl-peptidase-1